MKFILYANFLSIQRRSREGAWIEIPNSIQAQKKFPSRSREGAWIEIDTWLFAYDYVDGRSREGAWIEMVNNSFYIIRRFSSLPRGSVD